MEFVLAQHHSVANRFIAELRDVHTQQDRHRFRFNLERISEILAYEISKSLQYTAIEVRTPLGIATTQQPLERVVVAAILRAGMPMQQGVMRIFDQADAAFVSAYRKHRRDGTFDISLNYATCPNLDDAIVILCDPMLATGASIDASLQALLEFGKPKAIHLAIAIASRQGLEFVRRKYPECRLWVGDLDEELTAKSYIVPGLGDAGDLSFGPKLQA